MARVHLAYVRLRLHLRQVVEHADTVTPPGDG